MKTLSKNLSLSLFSFSLLTCSPSHAAEFINLTISDYGNIPSPARATLDTALGQIESSINDEFPEIDLGSFTKGSARSSVLATSGIGTEYVSDFDFGYLGVNAALSTDATFSQMRDLASGTASIEDFPGFGGAFALTLGLSLKHVPAIPLVSDIFAPDRTRGYLSIFSTSKTFTPSDPTNPSFKVGSTVFSAQGQYKIIKGGSAGLGTAKWGGLDLGAGIRYSKQSIDVIKSLDGMPAATADLESSAAGFGTANLTFTGNAIVGINSKAFTIPLEVSTSARLLHVLGVFVGTGADFNLGSAKSELSIDGPINITNDGITTLSGVTAQATANLSATEKPTFTNLKYFAGVQVELLAVGFSVQYTGSIVDSSKAVNAGVKLFW